MKRFKQALSVLCAGVMMFGTSAVLPEAYDSENEFPLVAEEPVEEKPVEEDPVDEDPYNQEYYNDDYEFEELDDGTLQISKFLGRYRGREEAKIPSEVNGKAVTSIGYDAFFNCSGLKSVIIPDSVTRIYNDAFYGCSSLTSIIIPDSVTSIGSNAFYGCSSLTSITIPDSVTRIDSSAFWDCESLTSITIPSSVTSTDMNGYTFFNCTSLTSINVDKNNPQYSSVDGVLYNKDRTELICCPGGKTSITIPDSVTSLGRAAFDGRKKLTTINVSENHPKFSSYEGALYKKDLTSLLCCPNGRKTVKIPAEATIDVSVFDYCKSIDSFIVDESNPYYSSEDGMLLSKNKKTLIKYPSGKKDFCLPDYVLMLGRFSCSNCSFTKLTVPGRLGKINNGAFHSCDELTELTLEEGITSIGASAFSNCSSLEKATLNEGLKTIGNSAFRMCYKLNTVNIPKSVEKVGKDAIGDTEISKRNHDYDTGLTIHDGWILEGWNVETLEIGDDIRGIADYAFPLTNQPNTFTTLTIPDTLLYIGNNAFTDCSNIKEINLSGKTRIIGSGAFADTGITSITIPEGITSISDYCFGGCYKLTEVNIPSSVKSIGKYAFNFCYDLKEIVIPDSVTKIDHNAFERCENLEKVVLPAGLETMGYGAFYQCYSLKEVRIPEGAKQIGDSAFYDCYDLSDVDMPDSIESVGAQAFYGTQWLNNLINENDTVIVNKVLLDGNRCKGEFIVPEGVTVIADYAFNQKNDLTKVVLPEGLRFIGKYAFGNCRNLTEAQMPESVEKIGDHAFSGCSNLTSAKIPSKVRYIGVGAFSGCEQLSEINVPETAEYIGGQAFSNTAWFINNYKEGAVAVINGFAIDVNKGSGSIVIPGDAETVSDSAFSSRSDISDVKISKGVKSIGDYAFYHYYSDTLKSLTVPSTVTEIGECAFGYYMFYGNNRNGEEKLNKGFTLYCTKDSAAERYAIEHDIDYEYYVETVSGDADGDGTSNMQDYALVQRYLAGWGIVIDMDACDLNGDGDVNMLDYALFQRKLAGWEIG